MLPAGENVSNDWRRKVEFLWGARGRRADVELDVEHHPEQQEYVDLHQEQPDVELQHMEEQKLEEELQAMDEEMEDVEPQRRRKKKEKVLDPEPLDDYPGGSHETHLPRKYHMHMARKAADGEVFINVKLTLNLKLHVYVLLNLSVYVLLNLFVKPWV